MKVAILNFEGVVPTTVTGPYDILDKISVISKTLNVASRTTFEVDIVDATDNMPNETSTVKGNKTIRSRKVYDLVLVPAVKFDRIENTLQNADDMVKWINYQYKNGSDISSICLGAFILAKTGLLDGKRVTTHWMGAPYFQQMYPQVILEHDKVIIDEGRLYTCGAAYSFTSLIIYLIEKFCGKDMAMAASKVFMIQVHQAGQNSFSIFNLQHNHNDKVIKDVQHFITENYNHRLNVKELGTKFNMSQRSFMRKFKDVTGNTPLEYIQRVKVEVAKRELEKGYSTVEEISLDVGYEDFNSFRNIFKRVTGLTPQEYKRKYTKMFNEAIVG